MKSENRYFPSFSRTQLERKEKKKHFWIQMPITGSALTSLRSLASVSLEGSMPEAGPSLRD